MREDPVRILRAVRFAARLDLDIESRTYAAMEGAVEDLPRCAPARLLEETFRLIRGGVARPALKLLDALDALKILLPPVDAYLRQHGKEGEKTFYAFAEALDRRVASGEPLDDAILLATLLMPISRAAPPPDESQAGPGGRTPVGVAGRRGSARRLRAVGAAAPPYRRAVPACCCWRSARCRASAAAAAVRSSGTRCSTRRCGVRALGGGHGRVPRALEAWKAGEVPPPRAERRSDEGGERGPAQAPPSPPSPEWSRAQEREWRAGRCLRVSGRGLGRRGGRGRQRPRQ